MEESVPLKSVQEGGAKSNLNVVTHANTDEENIEQASKDTGAIPKNQASLKQK